MAMILYKRYIKPIIKKALNYIGVTGSIDAFMLSPIPFN